MGDVIGDVNSRRGKLEGMEARNGMQIIRAFIPLAEMFGYATDLRSKTQGRGTYAMEPSHYEEVPKSVFEKIVASRSKKEDIKIFSIYNRIISKIFNCLPSNIPNLLRFEMHIKIKE